MKHITRTTALAGVALLALSACGPSEEEQAFLDNMGCEEGEGAEECGERLADDMMEDAPDAPSFSGSDTESGVDEAAQSQYSDRFATEHLTYGQHSVYREPDTGAELGTLTVQSIDSDYDCDGTPALAAEVEVNTVGESEAFTVDAERFVFINAEGEAVEGASVEGCDEPAEAFVRSDAITTEVMVFDVEMESGSMALNTHESQVFWEF